MKQIQRHLRQRHIFTMHKKIIPQQSSTFCFAKSLCTVMYYLSKSHRYSFLIEWESGLPILTFIYEDIRHIYLLILTASSLQGNILFIMRNAAGILMISLPWVRQWFSVFLKILVENVCLSFLNWPTWSSLVQRSLYIPPGAKLGPFAIWSYKYLIKNLREECVEIHLVNCWRQTRHCELTTE